MPRAIFSFSDKLIQICNAQAVCQIQEYRTRNWRATFGETQVYLMNPLTSPGGGPGPPPGLWPISWLSRRGGQHGIMEHSGQGTIFCQVGGKQGQKGQKFWGVEAVDMQGAPEIVEGPTGCARPPGRGGVRMVS